MYQILKLIHALSSQDHFIGGYRYMFKIMKLRLGKVKYCYGLSVYPPQIPMLKP